MTGKVKTDESRNEMRNSPGAPSDPANATILCFQAPSCAGNETCSLLLPHCYFITLLHPTSAFLLRNCPAIKMTHKHLHQRRLMQVRQARNLSHHPYVATALDGFAILSILAADPHPAVQRHIRCVH